MCNKLIHAFLHTCHTNGKGIYLWTFHTCGVDYGTSVPQLLMNYHNSKLGTHQSGITQPEVGEECWRCAYLLVVMDVNKEFVAITRLGLDLFPSPQIQFLVKL